MTSKTDTSSLCDYIVLAAGQGRRFGPGIAKQYRTALGTPLIIHTLKRLHTHPLCGRIQPVIAAGEENTWNRFQPYLKDLQKIMPPIIGGDERQQSVFAGLKALRLKKDAWVAIHDGVRPLINHALLDRLMAARDKGDALIAALPTVDTLKRVDSTGVIIETIDRSPIWRAQTPQLFRYGLIIEAHRRAEQEEYLGTDDASLVEQIGHPVRVVPGDERNLKITQPEDMTLAIRILEQEQST